MAGRSFASTPDNVQVKMKITLSYFIEPGPVRLVGKTGIVTHRMRCDLILIILVNPRKNSSNE